jgi:hypothetical protein
MPDREALGDHTAGRVAQQVHRRHVQVVDQGEEEVT